MSVNPIPGETAGDEVTTRIIEAAATNFARQGPGSVTIKWVCLEANVTPEQVFARWADVNAILGAVLDYLADQIERVALAPITDEAMALERIDVVDRYQQIVARALLDGINPATLQSRFPLIDQLVVRGMAERGLDERSARYRISQIYALEWGWRLFGPHLMEACGLTDEPTDVAWTELWSLEGAITYFPPIAPLSDPSDRPPETP